jgi:quercetin dioxygenase-like cupin family protein
MVAKDIFIFTAVFFWSMVLSAQKISIFPIGQKAQNIHHTGDVWLNELNTPDSVFDTNLTFVTMNAGARLNWHKHPGGQILMVTDGEGYYQERGKARQKMLKGDVIKCMPDVEHWHAATPDREVAYLAFTPMHKGRTVWLETLTDAAYFDDNSPARNQNSGPEQDVLEISLKKWSWMSDRKTDSLEMLFDDKAVFVHMGATFNKSQELEVIRSGQIQYKNTEIQQSSVHITEQTAVVLHKLRLTAIVGGNEVVNPFSVTEVYVRKYSGWSLVSLSFTRLLNP